MGADRVTKIAERLAEVERHIAIERARLEGKDDHEETELDELARRAVRLEEELASGPRPRRRKARLRFGLRHQLAFFGVIPSIEPPNVAQKGERWRTSLCSVRRWRRRREGSGWEPEWEQSGFLCYAQAPRGSVRYTPRLNWRESRMSRRERWRQRPRRTPNLPRCVGL